MWIGYNVKHNWKTSLEFSQSVNKIKINGGCQLPARGQNIEV